VIRWTFSLLLTGEAPRESSFAYTLWERTARFSNLRDLEDSPVGAGWNLYSHGSVRIVGPPIMLCQPLAEFCGPCSDYRVISSVVVWRTAKDIRSDHALTKHLVLVRNGVFDDVTQECLALPAGSKDRPCKHFL